MSTTRRTWCYAIGPFGVALGVCVAALAMPGTAYGDTACLKVLSETGDIVLGVDRQYLWSLDHKQNGRTGGFMVYVNWKDLNPRINNRHRLFEYAEVAAQDWSIDSTTAGASVRLFSKRTSMWPLRWRTSPNYVDVESELPGWRKVLTCSTCNQVQYFPVPDHDDIDAIECVVRPYSPEATCSFFVRIAGLQVSASIPRPSIRHYTLFLERLRILVTKFRETGQVNCGAR